MAIEEATVLAGVLTVSLLVLIAKVFAGLFAKGGIPSILGELSAGIIFGPYALGQFIVVFGRPLIVLNDVVLSFSEIGAILLLFSAGLEMTFAEFRGVGAKSFVVGGLGVVLPFALGFYTTVLLGQTFEAGLIVGAALSATSIAVTSKVLENLGMTRTQDGKLIINAAVVDDVLGLAVLAVVLSVIQEGAMPSAYEIVIRVGTVVILWLALLVFLVIAVPRLVQLIPSWRVAGTEEALSTAICFGSASIATVLGLSPIVGAYAAGMGLASSRSLTAVKAYIDKVNFLFSPIFFAVVGASLNFSLMTSSSLVIMGILVVVAVVSKLLGCGVPAAMLARSRRSGLAVGTAMVSRGEVGLVIAGLALTQAIVSQNVYAALVGVVMVTTMVSPFLLKYTNRHVYNSSGGQ